MEKQCLCEKPVVILHPNANLILINAGAYKWKGRVYRLSDWEKSQFFYDFPYNRFSPKRLNLGPNDTFKVAAVDVRTGQLIPIYMVVPCGKCDLCTHRKTRELSFRCVCETYSQKCVPFFVTLTYNDRWLPKDGVSMRDVQLFFKRLRTQLKRDGFTGEIRYICSSEYGKNGTHRPHYHLLLWNLPKNNLHDTLQLLQRAWSYRADRKRPIGFVSVYECTDVNYCLKYIYKPCDVPDGKNNTFHLFSRRSGGIGYKFCDELSEYVRKNLDTVTVSCFDLCSKRVISAGLPQYFKRRIFKQKCLVVNKSLRDTFTSFVYFYGLRNYFWQHLIKDTTTTPTTKAEQSLLKCFQICYAEVPFVNYEYKNLFEKMPEFERYKVLSEFINKTHYYFDKLKSFDLSCLEKWHHYDEIRKRREEVLSTLTIEPIDIDTYSSNVKEYNKRVYLKRKL